MEVDCEAWNQTSSEVGVPIEALIFVFDAMNFTPQYCGEEPGDIASEPRHCTADELCQAFVDFAKDSFGTDYIAALRLWNLDTSEKLGRVIYAMIEKKLLERLEGDQQREFDGKFDLSTKAR